LKQVHGQSNQQVSKAARGAENPFSALVAERERILVPAGVDGKGAAISDFGLGITDWGVPTLRAPAVNRPEDVGVP
jgi:hypothetical protein